MSECNSTKYEFVVCYNAIDKTTSIMSKNTETGVISYVPL